MGHLHQFRKQILTSPQLVPDGRTVSIPNYVLVQGGAGTTTTIVPTAATVTWTDPLGNQTIGTTLPYTVDGIYQFELDNWAAATDVNTGSTVIEFQTLDSVHAVNASTPDWNFFNSPNIEKIIMPSVIRTRRIYAYNTALEEIDLSSLTSGVDIQLYNTQLKTLSLPSYDMIGGSSFPLLAYNCPELTTIDLPLTTRLQTTLLYNNPNLTSINAPALAEVRHFRLDQNPNLTGTVSFPSLVTQAQTDFNLDGSGLSVLDVPLLTFIARDFKFFNCVNLTNINMPEMIDISGTFDLRGCNNLTELDAPKMTDMGTLNAGNLDSLTRVNFPLLDNCANFDIGDSPVDTLDISSLRQSSVLLLDNTNISGHVDLSNYERSTSNDILFSGAPLTSVDFSSLEQVQRNFYFIDCTNFTTLTTPALTRVVGTFNVIGSALQEIDMPLLDRMGVWFCTNVSTLTTLNAPLMTRSGNINCNGLTNLATFDFSSLEQVNGSISFNDATNYAGSFNFPLLTTQNAGADISFQRCGLQKVLMPLLVDGNRDFFVIDCPNCDEIDISSLDEIRAINISNCPLADINLGPLGDMSSTLRIINTGFTGNLDLSQWGSTDPNTVRWFIQDNPNLTSVSLPASAISATSNQYFRDCALDQASVDAILEFFATGGPGGTVLGGLTNGTAQRLYLDNISGGTNAAPSAAGLAHRDTLLANGWITIEVAS